MRAKLVRKVVHGPAPARAGAGHGYPGGRAVSLARLARWGRYGPLWAAMGRFGLFRGASTACVGSRVGLLSPCERRASFESNGQQRRRRTYTTTTFTGVLRTPE